MNKNSSEEWKTTERAALCSENVSISISSCSDVMVNTY